MLKIRSKYEQRYFVLPILYFLLPGPPALLLDDPADRIVGELEWTNQEFFLPILFHLGCPCSSPGE
jgi:hypothetical protein